MVGFLLAVMAFGCFLFVCGLLLAVLTRALGCGREEAILAINQHLRQAIRSLKDALDGNQYGISAAHTEIERAEKLMSEHFGTEQEQIGN